MKILELFAGSQPITRAAREYGHDTIALDTGLSTHPYICKGTMDISRRRMPMARLFCRVCHLKKSENKGQIMMGTLRSSPRAERKLNIKLSFVHEAVIASASLSPYRPGIPSSSGVRSNVRSEPIVLIHILPWQCRSRGCADGRQRGRGRGRYSESG